MLLVWEGGVFSGAPPRRISATRSGTCSNKCPNTEDQGLRGFPAAHGRPRDFRFYLVLCVRPNFGRVPERVPEICREMGVLPVVGETLPWVMLFARKAGVGPGRRAGRAFPCVWSRAGDQVLSRPGTGTAYKRHACDSARPCLPRARASKLSQGFIYSTGAEPRRKKEHWIQQPSPASQRGPVAVG